MPPFLISFGIVSSVMAIDSLLSVIDTQSIEQTNILLFSKNTHIENVLILHGREVEVYLFMMF